MKVLDLQCGFGHTFEGWFGSEADFLSQLERALVQCPFCGDSHVVKKLSAPRLNLGSHRVPAEDTGATPVALVPEATPSTPQQALAKAWLDIAKHVVANTADVGTQFAEEARKMHYGEAEVRGIRGRASWEETQSLMEEGIEVLPMLLPDTLKGPLQ